MQRAFDLIVERLEEEKEKDTAISLDEQQKERCFWYAQAFNKCINIVNQVASEYGGGWIPCSERLPEIEADVLLSLRSLDVYTGFRANTEGSFYVEGEGYVEFENVIAWQPLPEPYKAESEE